MQRHAFSLFADYFQFYLQDEAARGDLSQSWTADATERLLAVAPGTVGVGAVRNMHVPVLVEVHEVEPPLELEQWDHITECSLEVSTGRIVVAGCTDYFPDAARVVVPPGVYRARVSYGGLYTLSKDGMHGDDRYRVQLWLGASVEPRVLKRKAG